MIAKGYSQEPSIDFNETFALVARIETIRTILAIAAQLKLKMFKEFVKSAFQNEELEEEVFMEQPQSYIIKKEEYKVYCLCKALYALKQTRLEQQNRSALPLACISKKSK